MNIAKKMETELKLMTRLATWMEEHGEIISDKSRSNQYTGIRIREILWKNEPFRIIDVDGMTCEIKRL